MIDEHPPYFQPFLNGKMVLNNQIFRDLKGSTAPYDRTVDVFAYKPRAAAFSDAAGHRPGAPGWN